MVNEVMAYVLTTTERKVEYTVGKLIPIGADRTLLKSVWLNLLSNAVKYSSDSKPCNIYIDSKQENDKVIYSVQDNGIGFDMKYYSKLFKPFSRLHSASEYKGTGAGLAICNRIIGKHHGKIWAESVPNEGSLFSFSLPLKNSKAE